MKWIKEKLIYTILIFINFTFILRLLEKSIYIENFDYKFTSVLFFMGFLIYWVYKYILKKRIYRFFFTLAIFASGFAYYLKKTEAFIHMFNDYIVKNIITLNDLIYNGDITYFHQYKILLILILPLMIALILWITFRFIKEFILILSLAVVITLWFSNSFVIVKDYLFEYLFISSLTFIIMSYMKRIQKYKDEGVNVSLKFGYILIYGIVVSLIISNITLILPQEYKGRDLTSFGNYFENKFATGTSSISKNKYSLASSGYSNNEKKLGGPISINYQEVFKVKSDKPYYLKGNVKDFYDGSKWSKSNEDYFQTVSGEYMAQLGYGGGINVLKKSITIYPHKKFKTNSIFVPNYAFSVSGAPGTLLYDKAPAVLSEKVVEKEYNVEFYEYLDDIDTIEDVQEYKNRLRNTVVQYGASSLDELRGPMDYFLQPKSYNINSVVNENTDIVDKFQFSNVDDIAMIKEYSKYLQVPENISQRTYDLVKEITRNSQTSIEKVLDIKKYLTKNCVYELQVPVIPEDDEFIDYFLFQGKKGYCTYFNTAMTVMCRIAGVPTRYVEGFKTPNAREERGTLYSVSNADAHAWCEVLLGTSKYSSMWTIADASPTASEDLRRKLEELRKAQRDNGNSDDVDVNIINRPQDNLDNEELLKGEVVDKVAILSDNLLNKIKILTTIILFILLRIIKVKVRRDKLLKSKGVAPLYNYYLYRLATVRIIKEEHEGDLEFVEGIQDSKLKERMRSLVKGAYEEFYGKHLVAALDNKEYYDFLEKYLKEYQGVYRYLLNKYLGIF